MDTAGRRTYTERLMELNELAEDARALADRYRIALIAAGWSESGAEDAACDLLVGMNEHAVRAVFGDSNQVVQITRQTRGAWQ